MINKIYTFDYSLLFLYFFLLRSSYFGILVECHSRFEVHFHFFLNRANVYFEFIIMNCFIFPCYSISSGSFSMSIRRCTLMLDWRLIRHIFRLSHLGRFPPPPHPPHPTIPILCYFGISNIYFSYFLSVPFFFSRYVSGCFALLLSAYCVWDTVRKSILIYYFSIGLLFILN
jgi:hypothetical protein